MGFLSGVFKKKKGGTFFGNLIRGVASSATGGILGSGAQLAKNDAKIEQKEADEAYLKMQEQILAQTKAYQLGQVAGVPLNEPVEQLTAKVINSSVAEKVQGFVFKVWIKENWWKVLIPAVLIIGGIVWLVKRGNKNKKK